MKKENILTVVSTICVAIPATMIGLWISAFNSAETQAERVTKYNFSLPEFMHNTTVSTLISTTFCIATIGLSIMALQSSSKSVKAVNILLITIGGAILALNIFSLL